MGSPHTLPALRDAVARVLQARGEAADALRAIVEVEHAVAAERARCAAVCRAVAAAMADDTALACAEAIERGPTGGGL